MVAKYGEDRNSWLPRIPLGASGYGVWKDICARKEQFSRFICFEVNKGDRVAFWHDSRCTSSSLAYLFPSYYSLVVCKQGSISDHMIRTRLFCSWNLHLRRNLNNWEVEEMGRLLELLESYHLGDSEVENERLWTLDSKRVFRLNLHS